MSSLLAVAFVQELVSPKAASPKRHRHHPSNSQMPTGGQPLDDIQPGGSHQLEHECNASAESGTPQHLQKVVLVTLGFAF
jgi:hypothetical protein